MFQPVKRFINFLLSYAQFMNEVNPGFCIFGLPDICSDSCSTFKTYSDFKYTFFQLLNTCTD
jgi:hypothetical protein